MKKLRFIIRSLAARIVIIFSIAIICLYFIHIALCSSSQKKVLESTLRLTAVQTGEFIKKSLYYLMLHNQREQIEQTIKNLGGESGLQVVRLFNHDGRIVYSSRVDELGQEVKKNSTYCNQCHLENSLTRDASGTDMTKIYSSSDGEARILRFISPISNSSECSSGECHIHENSDAYLGMLAVEIPLKEIDHQATLARHNTMRKIIIMVFISIPIFLFLIYITMLRPFRILYDGTQILARGNLDHRIQLNRRDEFGVLANALNLMAVKLQKANLNLKRWSQRLEVKVSEKSEQLENMHREIRQVEKLASLGKLSATVAHELNNPLSGVVNYAKLLLKKISSMDISTEEKEKILNFLNIIQDETLRCGTIVKNLLVFARESGFNPQWIYPHEVIEQTIHILNHHFELNKVNVHTHFHETSSIFADIQLLKQAFIALTINAVEAMPNGGTLTFSTTREDNWYVVSFEDTGVGIPEEVREHLFEPFYSTKDKTAGVGLGLSVVYGIIKKHQGEIKCNSQPGKGSTFIIKLPKPDSNSEN